MKTFIILMLTCLLAVTATAFAQTSFNDDIFQLNANGTVTVLIDSLGIGSYAESPYKALLYVCTNYGSIQPIIRAQNLDDDGDCFCRFDQVGGVNWAWGVNNSSKNFEYHYDEDIIHNADKCATVDSLGNGTFEYSLRVGSNFRNQEGKIQWMASDGDLIDADINTNDQLTFSGGSLYSFTNGPVITGTTSNGDGNNVNNYITNRIWCDSTISGETTEVDLLAAGYIIGKIIFKNTTANAITNFDIGFTDGGGEVVSAANISASDEGSFTINQRINDFDAASHIYFSADTWNSANLIVWVVMERVF